MKKTENKMTLRRAFRANNRGLKLIYQHYPQMVLSHLISVVWNALTPYVGIFLSALVIDELVGNKNIERLQTLVIITLASAADEVSAKIINKEADIVAAPTNLAAVLYKKTEGQVVMLAANTLGNLYIVTKNAEISSIADLKGKTIYSSGQGASPEYVLNFLLKENGIDPEKDVEIIYKSEHAEVAPVFASEESVIALLPEPFVTNMLLKNSDLKVSVNITEEWSKVSDSELVMGCLIARKDFADQNPAAVEKFLKEYEESANYAVTNVTETAELSEKYGIMAKNVAEIALPNCNIVYIDGDKMESYLGAYFEVLFNANPQSVGGSIPDEKLYYKK